MTDDPILACMSAHRSVRRFRPDVPSEDLVRTAVAAAQCASTSSNVQGYCLLRVRDEGRRAKLEELTGGQPQVRQAGAFFCVCADQRRHRLAAAQHGRELQSNLETFLVDVIDAALFAQNLALAFEARGLGICYIGGLRTRLDEVDELLEVPADVFPLFGLCVGLPDEDPTPRPRLDVEAVLFDDAWPTEDEVADHVAAYDARMSAYYETRGKSGWNWSDGLSRKLARRHREHLFRYYTGKGAVLG